MIYRVRATRFSLKRPGLAPRRARRDEWKRLHHKSGVWWAAFNRYWEPVTGTKEESQVQKVMLWGGPTDVKFEDIKGVLKP